MTLIATETEAVAGPTGDVTQLLLDWQAGDKIALDRLMPAVMDELRIRARRSLRRERSGHTLQPTALINEVYLRLVDQQRIRWRGRAQFFGVAAQMMRRILVDHARRRQAARRGGNPHLLPIDEALDMPVGRGVDLIALDDALAALADVTPRASRVIELRFFGGLTIDETAEVLGISPATVKVDWSMARAWLLSELAPD